jgi:aldehyde:ferredoxin oxidoreductase
MGRSRGGYTGRMLRVDLTAQRITVEETPDVTMWLGSRGWNALIGWNEVGPGVDPYDAENRLVFSAGPLVGTPAPTSGRVAVSTLMPRGYPTPMWSTATMGGYWGAELKYAGYDGIIVQGQADAPCYLLIEDDKVSLQDAADLWGRGIHATQQVLKERHSKQHQIAGIGPAGENRVRFASIVHRLKNAVGNGGFGGVMGAKNLKAIAVRGTRGVVIADPDGFLRAVDYVWNLAKGGIGRVGQPDTGYPNVACTHGCSVRCGTRMRPIPDAQKPDGPFSMLTCVDNSWIGGSHPEYRGTSLRGESLYIPRPMGLGHPGVALGDLANDMGMTTWAYDTWFRYLAGLRELGIHEICGERFELESADWWRDWIMRVSFRQGLGDDYAEGLARFYDKYEIGPLYLAEFIESAGSRGHAWHREGRAMEPHPSPFWEYSALLYAVSTRDVTPSTHDFFFLNGLYGYPKAPKNPSEISPQLQDLSERLYGTRKAVYPGTEGIENVTFLHQHRAIIKDSMAVCDWVFPIMRRGFDTIDEFKAYQGDIYGDMSAEAVLYRPCTGIDMDIREMESPIAERIVNLERCIEVRNNGRDRALDEAVIPHYQWPEKTDGTHMSEDASEFRALLDRFYDLRGWDRETGCPKPEKLCQLGLQEAADSMERLHDHISSL